MAMAAVMQLRPAEPRRCHESCLQYLAIEMVRTFQRPTNGNGESGRSAGALEAIGPHLRCFQAHASAALQTRLEAPKGH